MGTWIDFKQLREQLDFAAVLDHYGVRLKANASGQHHGRCPLSAHPKESTSLTFSASIKKKIWRCFACNVSGNLLDFAVRMEGYDPRHPADVRKVALLLQERFTTAKARVLPPAAKADVERRQPQRQHLDDSRTLPEVVNPPLDFALKNLNAEHDFFRKRGILPATIEHFRVGYCTKGMLAGRIAIPLHDGGGKLVGYAGRLADEFEITDENVPYLWPGPRERNGVKHVFDRRQFLYHGHAIQEPVTDLVVVQSVESVWHLWQSGYSDVVGIMLNGPSLAQTALIINLVGRKGRIWLLTDGNKIGERCAAELFFDLGPHRFCRWVKLPDGEPTQYSAEQLRETLTWKVE